MKKVLALLGVMLFSASAFALNEEVPSVEDCAAQKASFEKYAEGTELSFVVQNITINMADPMQNMTDEQAQPLAACYATFVVKGQAFTPFVRNNADIFSGDIYGKIESELLAFADRVDYLSEKAALDRVVAMGNDAHVVEYILGNMMVPMNGMTDAQALPKARAYAKLKINGLSLVEYVRAHSNDYDMYNEIQMEKFADRVERLAK